HDVRCAGREVDRRVRVAGARLPPGAAACDHPAVPPHAWPSAGERTRCFRAAGVESLSRGAAHLRNGRPAAVGELDGRPAVGVPPPGLVTRWAVGPDRATDESVPRQCRTLAGGAGPARPAL